MKIAAVVILYHPTRDAILNIKSYSAVVDKIFVYDNSESTSEIADELLQLPFVQLFQNFKNEGISRRLNEACTLAINEQYEWLLTMDQDSSFSPDVLTAYFNCFKLYPSKHNVAMFGPNRSRQEKLAENDCTTREIVDLITSGSLLNLSLFNTIGCFDEALFIDLVDNEYCGRATMKGFLIVQFVNIYLVHELGKQVNNSSIKTLFLFRKKKEVHSPLRCYYMYRNMLYIVDKYKQSDKKFTDKLKKDVLARIKINLLYARESREILKYIKEAKEDFKNKRMGKYEGNLNG